MQNYQFHFVETPEPHIGRMKAILKAHPEVKTLFGPTPMTMVQTLGVVLLQIAMAFAVSNQPWWVILATSWIVGAVANHALFVIIHEATHNLIFKSSKANRWAGMIANLPIVFPSAMGFRTFHLQHHRYQGEMNRDADLASEAEARWVGGSPLRKSVWLFFFFFIEGVVRPARLKEIKLWDRWVVTNLVVELAFLAGLTYFMGWGALAYLSLSTFFCIGLHPVGARWIQEHYIVKPGQETYSYYGIMNKFCFNVGFHNEHHDLMMVPWSKLPELKKMAPSFYEPLHYHPSWTKLLFQFIFTPELNLFSRHVRPSRTETAANELVKAS